MSPEPSANTPQNESWRAKLKRLGKEYFELEEMLRLGFLSMDHNELEELKSEIQRIRSLRYQIRKLDQDLEGLEDIDKMIAFVRQKRIERVKEEREIRKAEKAEAKKKRQTELRKFRQETPPYLGKGISSKLQFEGGDPMALVDSGFPVVQNVAELASKMQLTTSQISWLCYHRQVTTLDHYTRFQIPKKRGGSRHISSPKSTLRKAQSWILHNILSKAYISRRAMAFREGKSVVDNARAHAGQKVIVRMDLKDFFPSIQFHRVRALFQAFGYNPGISTIFALICTDSYRIKANLDGKSYHVALSSRYLPQGACTSPSLSNIICNKMDSRFDGFCRQMGFTYTRYADDLVFSHPDSDAPLGMMMGFAKRVIDEEGFELNEEKNLVMRSQHRQVVTGLVVNEGWPKIPRESMRQFRAFLHQYEKEGEAVMSKRLGRDATAYARGYWAFVQMVEPEKARRMRRKYVWLA